MKRLLPVILIGFGFYAHAQQDPYYTHFKDVMQAYNPAAAGNEVGKICLSGLTHHQWRDFDDNTKARGRDGDPSYPDINPDILNVAPVTYNLNVGTVFKLSKDSSKFLGAGLTIIDDKVSYSKTTTIMANLNFKMDLQGGFHQISAGLGFGGTQWGFDQPDFKSRQLNDPRIPVGGGNQMKFDLNAGVMYKLQRLGPFKDFYAGLSFTNLNRPGYTIPIQTQGGSSTLNRAFVPHTYTLVGADYHLPSGNIVLEPAFLFKYSTLAQDLGFPAQFDVNVTALYASTFRGGIGYRQFANTDAASLLIGYVKGPLQVGYAYDITLSNIQSVSNGTHEILVKYCIPIVTKDPPPPIIRLTPRWL